MEIVQKISSKQESINNLVFVDENVPFTRDNHASDAIFVVRSNDIYFIEHQITKIRNSETFFLNPVFVICRYNANAFITYNADGSYTSSEELIDSYYNVAENIFRKIAMQEKLVTTTYDILITNKILRYLHSRELKSLKPFLNPKSVYGYDYPFLGVLFNSNSSAARDLVDFLKNLEKENFLKASFTDITYLCGNCHASHLLYREVCPACASANVSQKDLIHHFSCAYVGPKDDFVTDSHDLECPKCDKLLKHIGVDYDKPSFISTCNECEHVFQDVLISAKCTSCTKENEIDKLLKKEIKTYQVMSKSLFAAEHGVYAFNVSLDTIQGTVPIDVFRIMLSYEIERIKLANIESNLACIKLLDITQVFEKLGKETKLSIWADLVRIIRSTIKKSDILSFDSAYTLLFSLNETKRADAEEEVKKTTILIKKLIKDNLDGLHVEIYFKVNPIMTHLSHEEQIKNLINE